MEAYHTLERLVVSIGRQIENVIQADEKLEEWTTFHGWSETVDSAIVAQQAALSLVLRAMIFRRLSSDMRLDDAPPQFIIDQSNNLLQSLAFTSLSPSYLDRVASQTRTNIDLLAIDRLVTTLESKQSDIIGKLYTTLVPQDARRPLGQFWTPMPIAELMTQWAIQSSSDRVLDPAFGSGIFLLTVARRLGQLGVSPDAGFQQIAGVELSPLVWLMGLTNVLLRYPTAQPRLQRGDFVIPERAPTAVLKESGAPYRLGYLESVGQQLSLPGMEVRAPCAFPDRFDAIVCNPPYTRHHHLPEGYKSTWTALMKQEYGIRLSRFSSLFAYFLVQATRMLAPTGRMAFITPTVAFEASYSRQVKEFIRRQLRLCAIITFDESLSVFEGVDTAACITLMQGPGIEQQAGDQIAHVQISKWPGAETVLQIIEQGRVVSDEWGLSRNIKLEDLGPRQKWTVVGRRNHRTGNDAFVPLSDVARIMRGIATGANKFFVLSDDEVGAWKLNEAYLRPVLTKTREAPGYVFNQTDFERLGNEGKKRWLLYLNGPVTDGTPEAHYVHYGETLGLHQRSLVQTRSLWYTMEQRDPAPIYFTYLSRKKSRFIYNQAGVLALNVFLCIYPQAPISRDETMLKALLAVLNSLIAKDSLRLVGRSYGGDTIKIEPREMDRLPVLNPASLPLRERKKLAKLFDLLCEATSEETQKALKQEIDDTIAAMT
jgi:adenine-specific DNA-methyltransferase